MLGMERSTRPLFERLSRLGDTMSWNTDGGGPYGHPRACTLRATYAPEGP